MRTLATIAFSFAGATLSAVLLLRTGWQLWCAVVLVAVALVLLLLRRAFTRRKQLRLRLLLIAFSAAAALLWFSSSSTWREVIHDFKYNSHWYYAENIGRWLAKEFAESNFFEGIDTIVPVPLHWSRRLSRGYNQSEHLAAGIGHETGIPCNFTALRRNRNNPPQARRKFFQRWENISTLFTVAHPEQLAGRHILLVDDVFTSGATLITLARAISKACGGNVKISIATVAASRHLIEG